MHPAFQIVSSGSRSLAYDQCELFIDAGERHICTALLLKETREFVALEYNLLKPANREDQFRDIMHTHGLFRQSYHGVHVFYSNDLCVLVPQIFYNPETGSQMLEQVIGDLHEGNIFHDAIPELPAQLIYSVPVYMHEEMIRIFPDAAYSHFNSGWIRKTLKQEVTDEWVDTIFYPEKIIMALWKEGALQWIQTLPYETPEDVSYYLLHMASLWNLDPATLRIRISGLLETQSAMYAGIMKYFLNVELESRPSAFQYDFEFDKYPQHYFSPLFSLALCE